MLTKSKIFNYMLICIDKEQIQQPFQHKDIYRSVWFKNSPSSDLNERISALQTLHI